jgi:osmoprotectant transport system ATP-binding protein
MNGLQRFVFVTHDIDEAIKMGDRIAILKDGALLQYDTPERILAATADAFVNAFVGADRALKRASPITRATAAVPEAGTTLPVRSIDGAASLRDALALMLETGDDVLAVHSGDQSLGVLTLAAIPRAYRVGAARRRNERPDRGRGSRSGPCKKASETR